MWKDQNSEDLRKFNYHITLITYLEQQISIIFNFSIKYSFVYCSTVKELFATHMALFWMSTRHLAKAQYSNAYTEDDLAKLNHIKRSVMSLVTNHNVLQEITLLINQVLE